MATDREMLAAKEVMSALVQGIRYETEAILIKHSNKFIIDLADGDYLITVEENDWDQKV